MERIWADQPTDVRTVVDALVRHDHDVAYSTVKTVMERLVTKGELDRVREGRQYIYRTVRSRAETEALTARDLVDDLFGRYGDLAVSHFVAGAQRDPEQLRRLTELVRLLDSGEPTTPDSVGDRPVDHDPVDHDGGDQRGS